MNRAYGWAILMTVTGGLPLFSMGRGVTDDGVTAALDQPYDTSREVTFEGRVLRVDPAPCATLPISHEHLHMVLAQNPAEIDLGPCWYVQAQRPRIQKGDVIAGVGSEVTVPPGQPRMIVAREVRRGEERLRLRDAAGKPLWRTK